MIKIKNFTSETKQLLTKGDNAKIGGTTTKIGSLLSQMIGGIRKRLQVENRSNAGDFYEVRENRIIFEVPTLINKSSGETEYHKIVIQIEDEIEDPKKLDAIAKSANDTVSDQRPRNYDSISVFCIVKELKGDAMEIDEGEFLPTHTGPYDRLVVLQDKNPLNAIKRMATVLNAFYQSRAVALKNREKELRATTDRFSGYFGKFGNIVDSFMNYIVSIPGKFLKTVSEIIRAMKRAINNGKTAKPEETGTEATRKWASNYLDVIT